MDRLPDSFKRKLYSVAQPHDEDCVVAASTQELFLLRNAEALRWKHLRNLDVDLGDFYCFLEAEEKRWIICTKADVLNTVPGFEKVSLRSVALFLNPINLAANFMGSHLQHWLQANVFCGRCASPLKDKEEERARVCTQCDTVYYPRISPCIIVAIQKDDKILLARSPHFAPGRFSLLAGFVEAGETLEAAVHREVFEEVGLRIKNIQYFASQPWPFPDSLMVAFRAEYASGELNIDKDELESADWFTKHNLPDLPPKISISRRLIDSILGTPD